MSRRSGAVRSIGSLPVLLGLALLTACSAEAEDPCRSCGVGQRCEDDRCRCEDDRGCPDGAFCNLGGSCQSRPACRDNRDCDRGATCDRSSGRCLPEGRCPVDLHCPLESVCVDEACADGCFRDGDCRLGRICEGAGTAPGACAPGCRDNQGCALGEACVGGRCFAGTQPGLCRPCGGPRDCLADTDWCLENRAHDPADPSTGAPRECAVDCDGAPSLCPNGSVCRPVVVRLAEPCRADRDCPVGRRCVIDEGDPVGRCTCARDADCVRRLPPTCSRFGFCEAPAGRLCRGPEDCEAPEACGPYGPGGRRTCFVEPTRPCQTARDCQCVDGACVLSGRPCADDAECLPRCAGGGCVVGAGCVPEEGLTCPDL